MKLYLGIDGGQSSTTALIADEAGLVLGKGVGGPCNHVHGPEAEHKFRTAMDACLSEAFAHAGLHGPVAFAAACLGLSGGASDKQAIARRVIAADRYKITHDAETALAGATAGAPGVIVISGTGSIAFGRTADGRTARAGGWGYIFGDEGSAFDLVRQAVRACLQYEEGWGPETMLTKLLLEATGAPDVNALLHQFYTPEFPRSRVASYALLLDVAADQRDAVAERVVRECAARLAWYAHGVHQQLFDYRSEFVVSYAGGGFNSEHLRRNFGDAVRSLLKRDVTPPRFGPAEGALIEALRLDGNPAIPQHE